MKIIVLGGGVVGVATAYYLNRAGHEISIIDRREAPALETSYANAGQVSWSYASPWASPAVPRNLLKWLLMRHAPLVVRLSFDPAQWRWLAAMLGNCTARRYLANKIRLLNLARYSHSCLASLRAETGITYDHETLGTLQLFRDARAFAAAQAELKLLDELDIGYRVFDRAACLRQEPALASARGYIAGGIHYPNDETGDCYRFTQALAKLGQKNGVKFIARRTIKRLATSGDRIEAVETDGGRERADGYLVALGSYSPLLLRGLGIKLPVYPVKGYSATLPIIDSTAAPRSTLTDETYKVAVTRLGDRVRAAGTAELTGYDVTLTEWRCRTVRHALEQLFPNAGDFERASYWCGLRPMTPDNPPVLGATPYRNLYLNTGHGTLGWTLSCGSGKILSDIISGRGAEIGLDGLTLERFL